MKDLYRVMNDPIRRSILKMLAVSEKTQSDLVAQFSITQPALTKHLKILKEEGFIDEKRIGRQCFYSLNKVNFEASYHVARQEIEQILDHKLHSLKSYAEQVEKQKNKK
ncbi:ArsR/SmtB family transcription factor [Bacillus horti]|uniref:DNA-binding transcriptional ArsR family regulator n=1 Tax=Caldalkalibacillus horti TaxID=77523 RepID=A0ABT9VX62_9BACI|nr:metalloregulator ArsR/SmtB family transcription factor [Bacillus horti]MDQ0165577.1 DNA-binding transcriptional ArsR family regulator [Bacillus horti]